MIYKVLGLMSGSSLNGLDIAYINFQETAGKWTYEMVASECTAYPEGWVKKLRTAIDLPALDYQLLHTAYGMYIGEKINTFIEKNSLQHNVHLIASHGHTTFHIPEQKTTAQLGDGAAIAALTELPVVTDLRALDIAFGGQGAPIVPIGEKLLFPQYDLFLNLGGIANISCKLKDDYIAFDICAANRVLNMLANKAGETYDRDGALAATGSISEPLLQALNGQAYYSRSWPKSLSNDFGTEIIFPLLENSGLPLKDLLRTYTEHITLQVQAAALRLLKEKQKEIQLPVDTPSPDAQPGNGQSLAEKKQTATAGAGRLSLLVTGGGAFNGFLISCLRNKLKNQEIEVIIPEEELVSYKESLIMALIGLLRWREEYNVLATATGARRNSIGGALWIGSEA